ncbi:MAG TPA: hypothetical protein VK504_02180 [Vicinamibacterales bacterium]|jgi:hypothetical protein|nr:hypothetical protein [Vicinamibacterales bacterium]
MADPPNRSADEPRVEFRLLVPARDYAKAAALADKHQTTVQEIFTAAFRVATRQQDKLA